MVRKVWATAGATIALVAVMVTGGFGWSWASASDNAGSPTQAAQTQPVEPTATDEDVLVPTTKDTVTFVAGGLGKPCIGGDMLMAPVGAIGIGGLAPFNIEVHSTRAPGAKTEIKSFAAAPADLKRFVQGPAGIAPEGEMIVKELPEGIVPQEAPEDVWTHAIPAFSEVDRARHALEIAYSGLLAYENIASGSASASTTQLIDRAKAMYRSAHTAFEAEQYDDAIKQAFASSGASHAATLARQADQPARTVQGLTAPPAMPDDTADDRALCSLHQAYNLIGDAQGTQSSADADGTFFLNNATASYKQALSDYNAGRYDQAQARASSAAAAASVTLQLGATPTSKQLPDVPTPPEPATTEE